MRPAAVVAALAVLSGCGYVGPVLPPSTKIPNPVTDLSAAERGSDLVVQFTAPAETTDNVDIQQFSSIELRVGPDGPDWLRDSRAYQLSVRPAADSQARDLTVSAHIPAADWAGKQVAIEVRTAEKNTRFSAWSNRVVMSVTAPLQAPDFSVDATAQGYKLTWTSHGKDVQYHVYRSSPGDKNAIEIGATSDSNYTDRTAAWDTAYTYSVTETQGSAESLPSAGKDVKSADIFPPSIPAELTAIPGSDSIELSWQRSPESDTAGYNVFRSTRGSDAVQIATVTLPAYSDHAVEHGKTYSYSVSAFDAKGNESQKAQAVEAALP